MYDAKELEKFFSQYLPAMKQVIEDTWTNREELTEYLDSCLSQNIWGVWAEPYFKDMLHYAKTAPHTYTSPWDVLWAKK